MLLCQQLRISQIAWARAFYYCWPLSSKTLFYLCIHNTELFSYSSYFSDSLEVIKIGLFLLLLSSLFLGEWIQIQCFSSPCSADFCYAEMQPDLSLSSTSVCPFTCCPPLSYLKGKSKLAYPEPKSWCPSSHRSTIQHAAQVKKRLRFSWQLIFCFFPHSLHLSFYLSFLNVFQIHTHLSIFTANFLNKVLIISHLHYCVTIMVWLLPYNLFAMESFEFPK